MTHRRPTLRFAPVALLLCAAAVAACKDKETTRPAVRIPTQTEIIGSYQCAQMFAFYAGPQGTGWYTGSCRAYTNVTVPSRADSGETRDFTINSNGTVARDDYPTGTFQFDSATANVVINYPDHIPEVFHAAFENGELRMRQGFTPFDFSGDTQPDSLILVFKRTLTR